MAPTDITDLPDRPETPEDQRPPPRASMVTSSSSNTRGLRPLSLVENRMWSADSVSSGRVVLTPTASTPGGEVPPMLPPASSSSPTRVSTTRPSHSHSRQTSIHGIQGLDPDEDMADLTAEMALLDNHDDLTDSRTLHHTPQPDRSLSTRSLRPLSLKYKPSHRSTHSYSSNISDHDDSNFRSGGGARSGHRPSLSFSRQSTSTPVSYYSTNNEKGFGSGVVDPKASSRVKIAQQTLYRVRFVLRLLSLMGAGLVLGALAHLTNVYNKQHHTHDPTTDSLPFPSNIDLEASNLLLAAACFTLLVGLIWTIGSVWVPVRRLDESAGIWIKVAAMVSVLAAWVVWVAMIVRCDKLRNDALTETLFAVCRLADEQSKLGLDGKLIHQAPVDFAFHCGEMKMGWFGAIGVAVTDFLIFVTVAAGMGLSWWRTRSKGKMRTMNIE